MGINRYKLLLVEDDEPLAIGIEFTLKDAGYEVFRTSTVEGAVALFQNEKFSLIILDINLPDGNGYDLCKYIRDKSDIPVLFLTALDEEVNIVLGLEIGGDDYITKPFGVKEFLSRIKALIRRNYKNISAGSILKSGDIIVDTSMASIKKCGKEIALTAQEYKLLLIFMNKPEIIIKRKKILEELIEGEEAFFDENTLSVYIKRIREKIEDSVRDPKYIITQRGMGYIWNKSVIKE
ncbi:transcriptional regulatory protein WalR [Clostridium pasteurianum DSM 525 = ATCC 6013]|uniref:Stage 0 sporulation protein A homolog n=1 Tax=Clostridium pasteurianum DSM 525 = ATCC 6013 TaxID=1262449 RepID=A0A0H3J7U7_CLOPA|nr:response regulator transcription factor [Clostridium pasteurianum]AJA49272.1 transcriptional regulatory protein WalR [Clostridium pasteurianum DSM 525 = ATCC 6013]AJA53260.1 transcriptional regulatory protein WalR [Clostridium pasteurianum DSM 525 = ATCC 6013]AOZ76450.1 two-component system response regulator [Clostridium pasteurianum DSM 525 = ATCC 6013]AOZ80247.1 two-component system response regulator [Clostridium pasteurianum]ELP58292.1 transcriptional regulatory component of sensory tr